MFDLGIVNSRNSRIIDNLACVTCKLLIWFTTLFFVVHLFYKYSWSIFLFCSISMDIF
jgi:hypothetical protein